MPVACLFRLDMRFLRGPPAANTAGFLLVCIFSARDSSIRIKNIAPERTTLEETSVRSDERGIDIARGDIVGPDRPNPAVVLGQIPGGILSHQVLVDGQGHQALNGEKMIVACGYMHQQATFAPSKHYYGVIKLEYWRKNGIAPRCLEGTALQKRAGAQGVGDYGVGLGHFAHHEHKRASGSDENLIMTQLR